MKYTKVVEAIKLTENNVEEVEQFAKGMFYKYGSEDIAYFIDSRSGLYRANFGDYIFKVLANGGCYPCQSDVFEKYHKPCEE